MSRWERGSVPWNLGLTKETSAKLAFIGQHISAAKAGRNLKQRKLVDCFSCQRTFEFLPNRARPTRKFCSRRCASLYAATLPREPKIVTQETRVKMSQNHARLRGPSNPAWGGGKITAVCDECGAKVRRFPSQRGKYCSNLCRLKALEKVVIKRPTKPENRVIELIKKYSLPLKYVGDGAFWVGNLNPDFISTDGRQVAVEVFGKYWHGDGCKHDRTEQGRIEALSKYGWTCKVIWDDELFKPNYEQMFLGKMQGVI